ncbi:CHAT domain-containing protein [Microseira wollei]|uniref:TPR repeat protein n=1 Tax=Microseira wollei NIES-4236 TaxID=2530354 RepID=A0AAV3WJY5_9CYAN|nr:CHAT domain-containing protein [Microseira wollei]GET40659.1 TPR repeat protein [Microseira wollei NIES-4236]
MAEIKQEITSKVLLNEEFTNESFKKAIEIQPFPVVHLATHGQFSSNPDETFLLTWNDRISIKDFDLLFQNRNLVGGEPIELLVMSACQTATGDNRATLGLAGFALGSGARSTVASLWSVSDESTANLMSEFYQQLIANSSPHIVSGCIGCVWRAKGMGEQRGWGRKNAFSHNQLYTTDLSRT